jgi:3-hydroxyacyl-[acyl-carrier-protein] dehydratase
LLEIPDRDKKLFYFAAIDEARFRRPVVPGDQLRIEVTVLKSRPNFSKVYGIASVNGEIAAEATLRCMLVDREAPTVATEAPADAPVGAKP